MLSAINELGEQLATHYTDIPPLEAAMLPDSLISDTPNHMRRNMPGVVTDDDDQHAILNNMRLLVLVPENHPFVAIARTNSPRAHWGIGVPCKFSVAWVDNKYLWWHEALHLLNAKDCYNKFGINKCPEPKCAMQASPTAVSCASRLHLCSKNIRRLSAHEINW